MPLEMSVIRAQDFIHLKSNGEMDLPRSREALSRLAAECVEHGITCALLDVRAGPSSLGIVDLFELAESFIEMGFRREHRIAILHTGDTAERAKFFATAAVNRGWQIREFDSFERAFEWFAESDPAVPACG